MPILGVAGRGASSGRRAGLDLIGRRCFRPGQPPAPAARPGGAASAGAGGGERAADQPLLCRGRSDAAGSAGYLALVAGAAGWTAWRAVRDRRAPKLSRGPVFRAIALALAASGGALMVAAIVQWDVLTLGFAAIGIVYGGAMLGTLGAAAAGGLVVELAPERGQPALRRGARLVRGAALARAAAAVRRARAACADPDRDDCAGLWAAAVAGAVLSAAGGPRAGGRGGGGAEGAARSVPAGEAAFRWSPRRRANWTIG